jgi:bacterial/archaeal transporter family protein
MSFPRWFWLALLSLFCWGAWGLLAKIGSDRMTPQALQILFVAGMVPPVLAAWWQAGFAIQRDRSGAFYGILNGVLATFGMLAFYTALARGKASIVGPLTALFPLFTVAGALLFLKEKLNWIQGCGIVLALSGGAMLSYEKGQ